MRESLDQGLIPTFSYYMLQQSLPGCCLSESQADLTDINDTSTMTALYGDLKLFFQRPGGVPNALIELQVESDFWGDVQQAAQGDDAATVTARVAATGLPELVGLTDNVSGPAQAVVRLRNAYAPNVLLGYHLSVWGTGVDISISDPGDTDIDRLGDPAAAFCRSLNAPFDLTFGEFSDRDSAFKQAIQRNGPRAWWNVGDFRCNTRFLSRYVVGTGQRIVMWQIPLGNTRFRVMNNSWDHLQDNRGEWLLDDPTRVLLNDYLQAGVIAFLFGRGSDGATCACDDTNDGPPSLAPRQSTETTWPR